MKNVFIIICICALFSLNAGAQGLKSFQLPNGLKVFVWEDPKAPEVNGIVAVNVGSKEEPEDYTGLAHYLEHVLFKGTDKIGSIDWEKEKPIYEQIIAKYDEMANIADPQKKDNKTKDKGVEGDLTAPSVTLKKEAIALEINKLTQEAAQYNVSSELSGLVQGMGGKNLNAGTNYDYTIYYNSFPPGEIYKWLELYSARLINPVFRSFQPELETVYEEYNRSQDNQSSRESDFLMETLFSGHPYARSIIGLQDHLKAPRLSKLIEFYNTWYVPENMALIIVGNVKTSEILPIVKEKFGRLQQRAVPERRQYPETPVKGRKEVTSKISMYPQLIMSYPGVTTESEDDIAIDICTSILSNSSGTGLLDKLEVDGDLMAVGAEPQSLKERGTLLVYAVPNFDRNQMRFESLSSVEKMLQTEIKKLKEGKFEDRLVQSVKNRMMRDHELMMESTSYKASAIADIFLSGKDMSRLLNYNDIVTSITTEQIKDIAGKYFGDDLVVMKMNEGKLPKLKELEKPKFEPVQPVRGVESEYAKTFANLPVKYAKDPFARIDEVQQKQINDRSKLFYTKNPENGIFSLVLKYGTGTLKMPKLEFAVQLMSNAGVMGQAKAQEVKQMFSDLGASYSYSVDESYLYVTLSGFDENLQESCNLLTRQILLPQLDEKQMNSLQGSNIQSRMIEKKQTSLLNGAMQEYLLYGEKSSFIDRLSQDDIIDLTISNLTGEFQRATDYEAEIHYIGTKPLDEVYEILSGNLPLKQGEKESTSPEERDRVKYTENTVYFLPNSEAKQTAIFFFVESDEFKKEDAPYINAFNQYFSGGFTSLVLQEIREYRSLAYSAYGYLIRPDIVGKNYHFFGNIGTQGDKTMEAIDVFMDLLNNMPAYPDRMANLKNYLKETATIERPHYRSASQTYQAWKLLGYDKSPAETNFPIYEKMQFDDIVGIYKEKLQGRPVAIGVVGNPKYVDEKALKKYGKVIKLSTNKVFSEK